MTKIQDIIAKMIHPCEYIGGPLAGWKENSIAAPFVWLPFEDGIYVLMRETEDGRLIYGWRAG